MSNVAPRLWVGGRPSFDRDLPEFDLLALCAAEIQPERLAFHGRVIRCPIPDAELDTAQVTRVVSTARTLAQTLSRGQRLLVTCAAGLNRSALVAALTLGYVTRSSADQLIRLMRQRRSPNALHNQSFQALIRYLIGSGRRS